MVTNDVDDAAMRLPANHQASREATAFQGWT
jgi:hypothetical protein